MKDLSKYRTNLATSRSTLTQREASKLKSTKLQSISIVPTCYPPSGFRTHDSENRSYWDMKTDVEVRDASSDELLFKAEFTHTYGTQSGLTDVPEIWLFPLRHQCLKAVEEELKKIALPTLIEIKTASTDINSYA